MPGRPQRALRRLLADHPLRGRDAAAKDWQTFTSSVPNMTAIPSSHHRTEPDLPIELDPPLHTRYRQLIGPVFSRHVVEELRPAVHEIVDGPARRARSRPAAAISSPGFAVPLSVGTLAVSWIFPRRIGRGGSRGCAHVRPARSGGRGAARRASTTHTSTTSSNTPRRVRSPAARLRGRRRAAHRLRGRAASCASS